VYVTLKLLTPGVKNSGGTQDAVVVFACHEVQTVRRRFKESIVEQAIVIRDQDVKAVRDGEDGVVVRYGQ